MFKVFVTNPLIKKDDVASIMRALNFGREKINDTC